MTIRFGSEEAQAIVEAEPELLPCPFCGGRPELVNYGEHKRSTERYQIYCPDCQVYAEEGRRLDVVAHWNTRT